MNGKRLKSITLKNFKGFASEITILLQGKNLVLYGENGAGKTSIVGALKLLFDSSHENIELNTYQNIFTEEPPQISIELMNGETIELKAPEEYDNEQSIFLESLSRSVSILSYRELMRIYSLKTDEDFYDLFVRNIMANYLIPPKKEKTLIQLLREYETLKKQREKDGRKVRKEKLRAKEEEIKNEINKIFSEIQDIWNMYIQKLTGNNLEVKCEIKELGKLNFEAKWNGKDIRNILTHLNEGKLNAIALALFLAYYKKFNDSPYKMLLLDDVVIGLDMSLRVPLLDILKEDFEDEYQIILTTFDENWFKLMKEYLDGSNWSFLRLVVRKTDTKNSIPFLIAIEDSDYLGKARTYLNNGDYAAAALYARLEFERIVKKYAKKKRLKVRYDTSKIEDIWQEVRIQLNRSTTLNRRVEIYRAILLNPAVHYDTRPKYRREVKFAIDVVEKLRTKVLRELR